MKDILLIIKEQLKMGYTLSFVEANLLRNVIDIAVHHDDSATDARPLAVKLPDVKKGEVLVTVTGLTGCGKSAVAGEIEIALRAIGLPVTWSNGDAEKRMTGADWLTALEMYKPTVRILEVSVPRAAGGQVEGE